MAFSDRLKEARERKNITKKDLSLKIGRTENVVNGYESGRSKPNLDDFVKLINILDVDANFLLYDDLPYSIKSKILNNSTNPDILIYEQLDTEDKAEIRGEMKQMLKASKYSKLGTSPTYLAAKGQGPRNATFTNEQHTAVEKALHNIENEDN